MRKSFKAVLSMMFCVLLVSGTMLVSLAVGNISGLKASSVTAKSATISWSAASGADGYVLTYTTGSTTKSVTISGKSKTSYKLTLTPGKTYTVKVKSYDKPLIGKTKYGKEYSVSVKAVPAKVTNFKATNLSGGTSVKLTWSKVSGATGYVVQQYKSKKWTNIKTTTGTSLTVKSLKAGTEYKFRIAAYYKYNSKNIYGSYVSLTAKPTFLATSTIKVKDVGTKTATVYWSAVSGATKYQVYNATTKKYKNVTTRSLTYKTLSAGETYKVRVRGYATVSGKTVYGTWSEYFSFKTAPGKVTDLTTSNLKQASVDVKWNKISGATGYQVYLYNYATETNKRVKATTGNTYTVTGLEAGSTYRIGVRAYNKNGSTTNYGSFVYAYVDTAPEITAGALTTEKDIQLQWNEVRKATSYKLEKYAPVQHKWTELAEIAVEEPYKGTVKSESYVTYLDEGVGDNKVELYRLTAYNADGAVINTTEKEVATNNVTLVKNDYSVAVSWDVPADAKDYTVYWRPHNSSIWSKAFVISDPSASSYTFYLAPGEIHNYMVFASRNGKSGVTVANFTVSMNELTIDSSNESKNAQLLMLVNAINKAKLEKGTAKVTTDSYAKMVLDAIYMSEDMLDEIPGARLLFDDGKIAGDKIVSFFELLVAFGMADESDIPETVTEEDPAPVTYTFKNGSCSEIRTDLKSFIEPSGTADKLAYLYNQNNPAAWKNGFSSVTTTYYPETGKYKVVATLKQEKFGSSTSKSEAEYHPGFISVYDALGFQGEGVDNEITSLGATKLTAYIDAEGRIYNYSITSPFSTKFMASDGSDAGIGMMMSGTTTLSYKITYSAE